MSIATRLARLEMQLPKSVESQWSDMYDVDPHGLEHDEWLRRVVQRYRDNAIDKRATESEKIEWLEAAAEIESGLPTEKDRPDER